MTVRVRPRGAVLLIVASVALIAPTAVSSAFPSPERSSFAIKDSEPWIVYHWVYDPDGDGVNGHGIYMVRPDGRDQHLVLTAPAGFPDWSPDGRRSAL